MRPVETLTPGTFRLRWAERETQDAWATGLWVRLFNARKDAAAGGGPQLDRLAAEIGQRMSLAAI